MRPERRKPSRRRGLAAAPTRRAPRRKAAPRGPGHTLDELQRGKEAVSDIMGQLDSLLAQVRGAGPIDASAADRLAGAARQANRAFAALAQLRGLLP